MPYQFRQTGAEIQDILDQVGENTTDIAQNTQDISTLNSNLTQFIRGFSASPTVPPVYSNRISDIGGGYIKIGRMVFVSINCRADVALSASAWMFTGMPKPPGRRYLAANMLDTGEEVSAYVNTDGILITNTAVTATRYVAITGVYFVNS